MRGITERNIKTRDGSIPFPDEMIPPADLRDDLLSHVWEALGAESPEALRGFLHGMDICLGFITALQLAYGIPIGDPMASKLSTRLLAMLWYIEHSPQYDAAVTLEQRGRWAE